MKGVVVVVIVLLACFVVMDWWMLSRIQESSHGLKFKYKVLRANSSTLFIRGQNKLEPRDLWQEPFILASSWRPCADQQRNNGYILVSANGGINQQRVAVCNAVAVARLLNATLVVPHLLYSTVWRDLRNFLWSYDVDIMKEAKPSFYLKYILPILHRHTVVHFVGFGNRLSSDPLLCNLFEYVMISSCKPFEYVISSHINMRAYY
ncbi:hypothetical protein HYC85_020394 [Camellia sinensis]|uniref:O-fucosyltransferase family protein n=1 Tax=Camellia sinensis TaxID=4442 RepID=A0A7J7GPN2_CAMSI|nr:hypothetical protein HYC85_020394 [Camellia sinensis]